MSLRTMMQAVQGLARLRAERGNACEDCLERLAWSRFRDGSLHPNLQFSHVRPTSLFGRGRGMIRRYLDVKKHPEAYKLRCRGCHRKADGLAHFSRIAARTRWGGGVALEEAANADS